MAESVAKIRPTKKKKEPKVKKKQTPGMIILTVVFAVVSVFYVMPILLVLMNSFKINLAITDKGFFDLPNAETFNGVKSYVDGFLFGDYPIGFSILWSCLITVVSVVLILICTSMCAWYLQRSNTIFCKIIYYLCIFSMVVPFQVVMATLSKTADDLKLNTPWTIPIVYLGFGAGLAVFMFSGFVKSIPVEIEEAADVDGAGPLRTFFQVVLPIMKPTFISVAILETKTGMEAETIASKGLITQMGLLASTTLVTIGVLVGVVAVLGSMALAMNSGLIKGTTRRPSMRMVLLNVLFLAPRIFCAVPVSRMTRLKLGSN